MPNLKSMDNRHIEAFGKRQILSQKQEKGKSCIWTKIRKRGIYE